MSTTMNSFLPGDDHFSSSSPPEFTDLAQLKKKVAQWQLDSFPEPLVISPILESTFLDFRFWIAESEGIRYKTYFDSSDMELTVTMPTSVHTAISWDIMFMLVHGVLQKSLSFGGSLEDSEALMDTLRMEGKSSYYNLDGNLANPRAVIPYSADGSIKPLNLHGGDISDHSYSLPTVLLELGDSRTDKKLFGKVDLWLRDRPRQLKCQRPKLVIAVALSIESQKQYIVDIYLFGRQEDFPHYPALPFPEWISKFASPPTSNHRPPGKTSSQLKPYALFGSSTIVQDPGKPMIFGPSLTIPASILWRTTPDNVPDGASFTWDEERSQRIGKIVGDCLREEAAKKVWWDGLILARQEVIQERFASTAANVEAEGEDELEAEEERRKKRLKTGQEGEKERNENEPQ